MSASATDRARPPSIEARESGTDARALSELRTRQQAEVAAVERTLAEGAEPNEGQLDAEEPLVGVGLVGEAGLEDPAIAARDHADEIIALEKMRAGHLARRCARARDDR